MARKVLVADDSVTIQKVVGLTFANEDIQLSFVDNGEEAISVAKRIKPDLILADVLMPGKNGYEVCETIKADPNLRHVPVLLLTGTFEPFDSDLSAQVGADGTITKPFESQTLIREVRELLDRPSARPARTPGTVAARDETRRDDLSIEGTAARQEARAAAGSAVNEALELEAGLAGEDPSPMGESAVPPRPEESGAETEFSFMKDPDTALGRVTLDAPQTPSEGAPEAWASSPEDDLPPEVEVESEQESVTEVAPEAAPIDESETEGDLWDLSEFEAVEDSRSEHAPEETSPEPSDALWNEAASEAIDLVESTNLEADNEIALSDEPLADEAPQADVSPDGIAGWAGIESAESPAGFDAGDDPRSDAIEGESEFGEADLKLPVDQAPPEIEAPLFGDDELTPYGAEAPLTTGGDEPVEEITTLDLEQETLVEVRLEPIEEPDFDQDAPEQPDSEATPREEPAPAAGVDLSALTGVAPDQSAAIIREAVKDAVEKVTWEAFGDLSETVVRAVQEKVEKIAWEVIPEMAETIIKEEIRRLKEGEE